MNKLIAFLLAAQAFLGRLIGSTAAKTACAFALAFVLVNVSRATGVADTDISQSVDNVVSTWGLVKTAMIGIGVFLLAWGFFKRLRRA